MSFYGSMSSQLSNAFSRLLLRNNGKNNLDFVQEDIDDKILDAVDSSASVTLDSGNRWIQIQGGDDGCKIWHNAPDSENLTIVSGFIKSDEPPTPTHVTQLNSGDCLQVPVLQYDAAGHISPNGQAVYYKLPVIAIESDITDLKNQVADTNNTVLQQNSKIQTIDGKTTSISQSLETLKKEIGTTSGVTGGTIPDLSSAIGKVYNLKGKFGSDGDYLTVVDTLLLLKSTCESQQAAIEQLQLTVKLLGDKLGLES